jgi:hypothetical protein
MTLAQSAGKLLGKSGKLAARCACCCTCFSPFCCRPDPELYLSLSFSGARRQSSHTYGTGSTAYTISIDFTPTDISSTYTLTTTDACARFYGNGVPEVVLNPPPPGGYGTIPYVYLFLDTVASEYQINVSMGFNGGSNYRRTGYLPAQESDQRYILGWSGRFAKPPSVPGKYGCNQLPEAVPISMAGTPGSASSQFNLYGGFVGQPGSMSAWSPPVTMTAQFLPPP